MPSATDMATMADPPALRKGSGRPVTGMSPIVIPMFTKMWNISSAATPTATS